MSKRRANGGQMAGKRRTSGGQTALKVELKKATSVRRPCVSANRDYIPPEGKGSLYLRPLLIGSGPILGLGPAPSYTFLIYCSPVASYFKVRCCSLNPG